MEYGFEGRPPYFDEFYQEFSEINTEFPKEDVKKPIIGMGLDYKAPTALFLGGEDGNFWGISVSYYKLGKEISPKDFISEMPDYFTESLKKKYSYFSGGDITCRALEYAKGEAVIMVSALDRARIKIKVYSLHDKTPVFKYFEKEILCASEKTAFVKGEMEFNEDVTKITERYKIEKGEGKKNRLYLKSFLEPERTENKVDSFELEYVLDEKNSRALFYIKLKDKGEVPSEEEILRGISAVELEFSAHKINGSGALYKNVEKANNALLFNRIYDPYLNTVVYSESRAKVNNHYAFSGTSLALSSMFSVLHGNNDDAYKTSRTSCKDKMLGAFSVWFIYSRTRNKEYLTSVIDLLTEVWAPDGKLVVSLKPKDGNAAYNMKNTASKNYDKPIYALDTSCYKLTAYEIISKIYIVLKDVKQAKIYKKAYDSLKSEINTKLYNEELKIYSDRYIAGGFLETFSALSFLPFFSGAVDTPAKCEALLSHLTDKYEFWDTLGISYFPKGSPAYNKSVFLKNEGWENRAVYPVLQYLIYLGLRRYGIDDVASDLAIKCSKTWEKFFKRERGIFDAYAAGMDTEKRIRLASSGNLLACLLMFDIIDVEYYEKTLRPSISFGTKIKGSDHGLSNARLFKKRFSISVQEKVTRLYVDGKLLFEGEGGRFEVRNFLENKNGAEFYLSAASPVLITLALPFFAQNTSAILIKFMAPEGKSKIRIVNGKALIEKINS